MAVSWHAAPMAASTGIGPLARQARAEAADAWLTELFQSSGAADLDACLVAVGGYGRRELAPGSDLDAVLLLPVSRDVSEIAERLWYPIWDSGTRLDHSVRTVAQARALAAEDIAVLIGLLDARAICGDAELLQSLRAQVLQDWRQMARRRLPDLHEAVMARRDRAGDLAHLLEPDLKEAFGGLRDVMTLRALTASWLVDVSHIDVESAHALLMDVRDALHTVTGRVSDRLTAQDQDGVAEAMGGPGINSDRDGLLRAVSRAGRTIAFASERAWQTVLSSDTSPRSGGRLRRLGSRRMTSSRAPLADGVVLHDGQVVLALSVDPASDPGLALRTAAAAAQARLPIAAHTLTRLARECPPPPTPWPRLMREAFVSLLGAGRATVQVWESLDQAGIIETLLPEWEPVRSAPQRDPIHRFTVDRHLVETAVQASALTRRVARPDLLLVGALFHDIGKARGGDHTDVGIDLVAGIAPRLGFDADDTDVLVEMVRWHLLLPQVATRRDPDDPATIAHVLERVPRRDILDLLHALAIADARATGPSVSSEWRLGLIDTLVARVHSQQAGAAPVAPALFYDGPLPDGDDADIQVVTRDGAALVVSLVARDRAGLLATTAAVLALHRLDVRAARTETVGAHALAEWTVVPRFGSAPDIAQIREDLRRSLRGTLDAQARLDRATIPEDAPAAIVTVHPGASATATVLEVRAHDAPGLLGRLAGLLTGLGLDVRGVRADTLGSEVVDVFYVCDASGAVLDPDHAARVASAVADALGGAVARVV